MFSLFYGLWKYLFSNMELHVLIQGIDKVGKMTLLEKMESMYLNLEGLPPDRIVQTVGLNIDRIEVTNRKLVFWDLGGQVGLRSIWEKYYEEVHAVIFAVDAALSLTLRRCEVCLSHGAANRNLNKINFSIVLIITLVYPLTLLFLLT